MRTTVALVAAVVALLFAPPADAQVSITSITRTYVSGDLAHSANDLASFGESASVSIIGSNVANLWIDDNGGTCTRNSSPAAYVDAAACSSADPDTAYTAASCGDSVYMRPSSGTVLTIPDWTANAATKTGCGANVTLEPADGFEVELADDITVNGPSYLTFRNMTTETPGTGGVEGSFCAAVTSSPSILEVINDEGASSTGSHEVVFDNVDGARKFNIVGWVEDVTIRDSEFGPGCDAQPQIKKPDPTNSPEADRPRGVLIDGTYHHDFARSDSGSHTECLQILNGDEIIIRKVKLFDCDGTGALGITPGSTIDGLTIENSWIGVGAGDPVHAVQFGQDVTDFVFRHNTLADDSFAFSDTEIGGPYTFTGNYVEDLGCDADATYTDNVVGGSLCSGDNGVGSSAMQVEDLSGFNWHLSSGSNALGQVASCGVSTDIDADPRPGSNCDAGADER
jgi:hypothetical protein